MLKYATLLLVCQLVGEFTVNYLSLPFPGPVVGMLMLFIYLVMNRGVPAELGKVADQLLKHLSLLFVPAGVGVMVHLNILGDDFVPLTVALFVSTVLALGIGAFAMQLILNKPKSEPEEKR